MNNTHGNLYWVIEFTGLYNGVEGCDGNEEVHISVRSYVFADAYKRAEAMYEALLKTHPSNVYCARISLRDDGSVSHSNRYKIYASNYINEDNITAFFSAGADNCMRLTWRG